MDSRALYLMKRVSIQRLYTIWFHFYNILKMANYKDVSQFSVCHRVGQEREKGSLRELPYSNGIIPYIDCFNSYMNLYV